MMVSNGEGMKKTVDVKMKNKKMDISPLVLALVITLLLAAGMLAVIFGIDYWKNGVLSGVPADSLDASIKLQNAGYTVEIEKEQNLRDLTQEASNYYDISLNGLITGYLKIYDPETVVPGAEMAEIFYLQHESDANVLYEKMKQEWNFSKEEGELRLEGNVIYMGRSKVLDALEK